MRYFATGAPLSQRLSFKPIRVTRRFVQYIKRDQNYSRSNLKRSDRRRTKEAANQGSTASDDAVSAYPAKFQQFNSVICGNDAAFHLLQPELIA